MDYNHKRKRSWKIIIIDVDLTWNINIFDAYKPNL